MKGGPGAGLLAQRLAQQRHQSLGQHLLDAIASSGRHAAHLANAAEQALLWPLSYGQNHARNFDMHETAQLTPLLGSVSAHDLAHSMLYGRYMAEQRRGPIHEQGPVNLQGASPPRPAAQAPNLAAFSPLSRLLLTLPRR